MIFLGYFTRSAPTCVHREGLSAETASRQCQRGLHHCTRIAHTCSTRTPDFDSPAAQRFHRDNSLGR